MSHVFHVGDRVRGRINWWDNKLMFGVVTSIDALLGDRVLVRWDGWQLQIAYVPEDLDLEIISAIANLDGAPT